MISSSPNQASRVYARYALCFLAATVLAGVWLRVAMVRPDALAGYAFRNLVHAHSHLAFFGWVSMAMFGVIVHRSVAVGTAWTGWHAHLVGFASAAAFVGFLREGYSPATIALSALHVALWVAFTVGVWPTLKGESNPPRGFFCTALVFLMLAGAGTVGTGILSARAADAWTARLAIELFLTPFVSGWLVLGAFGVAYARISRPHSARAVLILGTVGALPSGLLHIAVPAPAGWIVPLGRVGMLMVGFATLLFATDLLRNGGARPLLKVAGGAAVLKGAAEIVVGVGIGAGLVGSPPLVIGYLHLVLLGMVTSILADAVVDRVGLAVPATLHGCGLVLQVGALAASGTVPGIAAAARVGFDAPALLSIALLGGVLSAAALILVVVGAATTWRVKPAGRPARPRPPWSAAMAAIGAKGGPKH